MPETLSAITMKLLVKNAEERYQTASGLEADLGQCLSEWETKGRIDSFPLATHDVPERLPIRRSYTGGSAMFSALRACRAHT